jgi:RNA polymerase sigma factor (sigma-70 family)
MPELPVEELARCAVDGDREALGALAAAIQGQVYRLAVRMLWNREDAEDATQEILVRVVTRLAQFDFRSRFTTWVYRISVNYLLDVRKSPTERLRLTFETFAEDLGHGLSDDGPGAAERSLLVEEVKVGCTLAMLQCLDRPHRLAYVFGEILEMPGPEGAAALETTPDVFRKRLQRARDQVTAFTRAHCGLVSATAGCACHRRVRAAVAAGRIRGEATDFASSPVSFVEARDAVAALDRARQALAIHRLNTPRPSTIDFARQLADRIG